MSESTPSNVRKSRVTVVEQVCFQPGDSSPTSTTVRYGRWLESDEAPYSRDVRSSPELTLVDRGWVTGPASILTVVPAQGATVTVVLGDVELCTVQHPESLRVPNPNVDRILLLVEGGKATVTVYPA